MLGLYNYIANSKAVQSIIRSGLQLFYKTNRTQAPLGEEQVLNNSFDELGPDEIVNGNFETGISGWGAHVGGESTITYNSTLKGIKLTKVGSDFCKVSHDGSSITQGETYKLTYKVLENNNCTGIQVWNGGGYEGASVLNVNANGEDFVYYLKVTGGGSLKLFFENNTADSDITLSNIRLEQVDPNDRWTLATGWSVANGVAIQSGGVGQLSQTGVLTAGKSYSVSVTIDSIASGTSLKVSLGSAGAALLFPNIGTTTLIGSTHSSADNQILYFLGNESGFSGSISNISVKEITNSIKDHSKNSNDGTLYSGKALDFDGTGDYVTVGDTGINMKTVAFWIFVADVTSNTEQIMEFKSDHGISSVNGTITTAGTFANKVIYVNGSSGTSINASTWSRIVITTTTAIDVNQLVFGTDGSSSGTFVIADFQLYDKTWNATDVKYDWENPDKDVFDRVDEAQALGEELVSNGDFSNSGVGDFTADGGSLTQVFNELILTTTTTADNQINYNIPLVVGKTYKATLLFNEVGSSTNKWALYSGVYLNGTTNREVQTYGVHTVTFVATNTALSIQTYGAGAIATYSFDNISVKEVTTHASHILPTDCKSLLRLNEGAGDRVYDAAPVLGAEEVQNGTFELGSEEITDGDFSSSVNWAESGDQWVINNNTATYTGDGNANELLQEISFIGGRTYQIKIDVASIGGTLKVRFNNEQANKAEFSQTGIQTLYITATGSGNITDDLSISREPGVFNAVLNSVSVKEVPNWVLGDGWSALNGKARNDGTTGTFNLSQGGLLVVGKSYQITIEVSDFVSGEVEVSAGGTPRGTMTANGKYTFNQVADGTVFYIIAKTFNGSVDNVSVKEIKPAESFAIVGTKAFIHQQPYIPQYAMSSFSKKMLFDGSNDYVNCSSDASIDNIFSGGGTFSCWISPETDGGQNIGTIIGKGTMSIRIEEDDSIGTKLVLNKAFSGDNGTWSTADDVVLTNKLNHIVVTYNSLSASNNPVIYVNGISLAVTEDNAPTSNASTDASSDLFIGNVDGTTNRFFDGIIDEVSMFKTILTQAEVLELYNSGSAFDTTGHSKYNLGEEVSNGTLELGSELSVNGDFINTLSPNTVEGASGTSNITWDSQAGGSAKLIYNSNDNTALFLKIPAIIENGKNYYISIDATTITDGSKIKILGDEDQEIKINIGNGTTNFSFLATHSVDNIRIYRQDVSQNSQLYINSFTIKEIPNWSFGDGWSYVDGKASLVQVGNSQATDHFKQELTGLVNGRTYVVGFDLGISTNATYTGLSSGGAFGNIDSSLRFHDTSGRKTFTAVYNSSHEGGTKELIFAGSDGAALTIDNVSVQEYGLSAYWRNNGADQWDDLSINSNHGTVSGSPTEIFLQEVPFFGKDSLGMFMNKPRLGGLNLNTSGYVGIEDNNDLDFGTGAFTMECWVIANFTAQGSEAVNVILSLGGNVAVEGTAGLGIKGSTGKIRGYVNSEVCDMNGQFTTGQWYHVVTTRAENGLCTLYLDAVAQTDTETTTGNVSNSHSKFIGKDTNAERFYDGVIDDVKLYNKALTPTEIKKNFNATKGRHKN